MYPWSGSVSWCLAEENEDQRCHRSLLARKGLRVFIFLQFCIRVFVYVVFCTWCERNWFIYKQVIVTIATVLFLV